MGKYFGTDGFRGEARILVRESGTEPVVRVMAEAETTEICQEMVNKVVEVMKRKGL